MLDHAANPGRHALKARKDDLYETPAVAVQALMRAERLPPHIWEPACGPGAIVAALRAADYTVSATDLVAYGCPGAESGVDFLMTHRVPSGVQAIVTNPPFKLAAEFASHAISILFVPKVCMLLRLAFLESERRSALLDTGLLARVYVFRNRLPMMHRDGWQGNRASSSVAFAWFVWEIGHKGPTELRRISWQTS